jgi:predicted nucleic acid-binding protein
LIVSDTNLIACLLVDGPFKREAQAVYEKDPDWVAPPLWRSEFRHVLIQSLRHGLSTLPDVLELMELAGDLMGGREIESNSTRILRLAADSGCSAYDCEFVALAQDLGISMVSSDRALIAKFKPTVVSLKSFCS